MIEILLDRYVYMVVLALLAIGLYGMLVMGNLAKKLVGLTIFSSAIFLFFISGAVLDGGAVPIIDPLLGADATNYADPVPHLLILTAIVVGVAILGVGLALLVRIHHVHGTLDETEVARRLADGADPLGTTPDGTHDAAAGAASDGSPRS